MTEMLTTAEAARRLVVVGNNGMLGSVGWRGALARQFVGHCQCSAGTRAR